MDANPNYKLHATFNKVVNEPKHSVFASNIYLFKVNNKNNRKICEISSKLTTNTLNHPSVFIVNLKHIPQLFLVYLLLTLNNREMLAGNLILKKML